MLLVITWVLPRRCVAQHIESGEANWVPDGVALDSGDNLTFVAQMGVGEQPGAILGAWDPQILATWGPGIVSTFGVDGTPVDFVFSGATTINNPWIYDFVRGGQRGQLLAAPTFWLSFNTNGTVGFNNGTFIVTYRIVKIGIWEFLGMLQSQS